MEKNFTSLDVAAIQQKIDRKVEATKSFDFNAIFLILIVVTLIVLSSLLFLLIQKKLQELALVGLFA